MLHGFVDRTQPSVCSFVLTALGKDPNFEAEEKSPPTPFKGSKRSDLPKVFPRVASIRSEVLQDLRCKFWSGLGAPEKRGKVTEKEQEAVWK